jgi:hypothetical protein
MKNSFLFGAALSLLIISAVLQGKHDAFSPPFTLKLEMAKRTLLPETILPYVSFGFNNFLADMYWVRAIQDFVAWDGREGFFIGYFKNITKLDPRFEYPYLFSILTVPQGETTNKDRKPLDEIAKIAERGIQAIPTSWQIPFYLGTQYQIFTRSYDPAEKYLAIAAERPNAPDGVYLVYSTYVGRNLVTTGNLNNNKEKQYKLSRELIKVIYNNTDDEIIKSIAEEGYKIEAVTQMLEKGIIAYNERFKRYPVSIEEMEKENFIRLPQDFIETFTIRVNGSDGTFRIVKRIR